MGEDYESAIDREPVEGQDPLIDEYSNPAGVSRGACDTDEGAGADASCDLETTAQVEDLVLEETKPGRGISGFEGEEVGGA
jgi:hypothetical protein